MPATLDSMKRFATSFWNVQATGTPIFAASSVKASMDTQTYSTSPPDFWSSR